MISFSPTLAEKGIL